MKRADCKGKVPHESKAKAKLHAKRHAAKFGGSRPDIYQCGTCLGWHLATAWAVLPPKPCRVCGTPLVFDFRAGSAAPMALHAETREPHHHRREALRVAGIL